MKNTMPSYLYSGNAWFVEKLTWVDNADEEIKALDSINTKREAIIAREFESSVSVKEFSKDSTAQIELISYKPNEMVYRTSSSSDQFAVFSDMYYGKGWNAYLNGSLEPHVRANYVLRAMNIPAGDHELIFKFEPEVIQLGTKISLISYALFLVVPIGWFFYERKKDVQNFVNKEIYKKS